MDFLEALLDMYSLTYFNIFRNRYMYWGFPGGSDCKESACNARDVGSILGQEDHLEKGMATHPSIPAWRIPWTEEPCGLQSMGLQRVKHNWVINTFCFFHCVF